MNGFARLLSRLIMKCKTSLAHMHMYANLSGKDLRDHNAWGCKTPFRNTFTSAGLELGIFYVRVALTTAPKGAIVSPQ